MGTSVTESWSKNAIQPTMTWLKEGLINGCVTRDLTWGLPGRHVKYKDKVGNITASQSLKHMY